jgi:hypothetical protein
MKNLIFVGFKKSSFTFISLTNSFVSFWVSQIILSFSSMFICFAVLNSGVVWEINVKS